MMLSPITDWTAEVAIEPDPDVVVQVDAPLYGVTPLDVNFTDLSLNNPSGWLWDFGDGSSGADTTQQNPTHTYTAPGLYTVSLTATNVNGSDYKKVEEIIRVTDGTFPGITEADPEGNL